MSSSYHYAVGSSFFPTMKAPLTFLEYVGCDYVALKAKSIFQFLYDASPEEYEIDPVDVPCTWALMCALRPLFEYTKTLNEYPATCDVPLMMDGLDTVCATYGMRQVVNMIRSVTEVQNDFSTWRAHLVRRLELRRNFFTATNTMQFNMCSSVEQVCVTVRERLFHNLTVISMHAEDLHAVGYRECRGKREYELGTDLYLNTPIWELKPTDGVGPTLAFFCSEAFKPSNGGNEAIPLLPP